MGIPRRIGAFVPFAEIAQGPATGVYKAHDPEHDRIVVVKLLRRRSAGDDDLARRFRTEAAALRAVTHPNVVDIVAFGECEDGLYIATRYVEGESLAELLTTRSVPAAIGAFIVRQAVAGLAAVHQANLLHRDFKPSNILVGETGEVRLLDFGLALAPSERGEPVSGTVGYLAPELLAGDEPGRSSDLYSAGVTLAEVLTGRPAERLVQTRFDGRTSIARGSGADPIRELISEPGIDRRLAECAAALAAPDPSDRPSDADAALAQLDAALDTYMPRVSSSTLGAWLLGERLTLPRPGWDVDTQDSTSNLTGQDAEEESYDVGAGRASPVARRWAGVLAATALVAVGVFAVSSLRSDDPDATTSGEVESPAQATSGTPSLAQARPGNPVENDEAATAGETIDEEVRSDDDFDLQRGSDAVAPDTATTSGILPIEDGGEETDPDTVDSVRASVSPNGIEPSADPTAPATVTIVALPWARVVIDGTTIGVTPLAAPITLAPGMHAIRFENPDFPPHDVPFEVLPGDTTDIRVSLWSTVARVMLSVTPWAEVFVDGTIRDTIPPMDQPLILRPGETTLTLRHPDLGVYETTLSVRADSTYRFSFNLFDLAND